jgi:hypothetical protein
MLFLMRHHAQLLRVHWMHPPLVQPGTVTARRSIALAMPATSAGVSPCDVSCVRCMHQPLPSCTSHSCWSRRVKHTAGSWRSLYLCSEQDKECCHLLRNKVVEHHLEAFLGKVHG